MNCEQANNLISAKLDGQIRPEERSALDAHLAECTGCRAAAEALAGQDADLRHVFAPHRERVAFARASAMERIEREQRHPRSGSWLTALLSAAAGFALALLILQPWMRPPAVTINGRPPAPAALADRPAAGARLALATGQIEVLAPGATAWEVMPTGASVALNSRIRTGDHVRCELVLDDGSEVRLNSGTELRFSGRRSFDLANGQMWSTVARADDSFTVTVADATVTALGTQFDIVARPQQATVRVVEGATRVTGREGVQQIVQSGEQIEIRAGSPAKASRALDLVQTTNWVNELLVMKGRDNAELHKRVNLLLAELGHAKMTELFEPEIRALGDHCVLPLTRYLQSERSRGDAEAQRRHRAARILADLAQPWSIPDLIDLLTHHDGEVRYSAARALERLTGTDLGRSAELWRTDPSRATDVQQTWKDWWEQNRHRYPAGPIRASAG